MKQTPYAIERDVKARIAKLPDAGTVTFDVGDFELEVTKSPAFYGVYFVDKRARDMSILTIGIPRSNPDAARMIAYTVTALHIAHCAREERDLEHAQVS